MQLSELYRRGIVMPRSEAAQAQLSTWYVQEPVRVEVLPFLNEEVFYRVWDTGLFAAMNKMFGTHIDDYEEESLTPEQAGQTVDLIDTLMGTTGDTSAIAFMKEFQGMAREAARTGVSIFLIL